MNYYRKFPVKSGQQFGYILMSKNLPPDAIIKDAVVVCCIFCGIGEEGKGTEADLEKIVKNVPVWGMKDDAPQNPTCATSMNYWPVVYLFVQSTAASAYRSGEVDFIIERSKFHFPNAINPKGKPVSLHVSMGGFVTEVPNVAAKFSRMLLMMTGNTNANAKNFAKDAAAAETELYYYHAINDTTAPPALSVAQFKEFINLNGKGYYVMYAQGQHGIVGWPVTAFYPGKPIGAWRMWNNSTQAVTPESEQPMISIYDTMTVGASSDKLILTQGWTVDQKIYQKSDGSIYTVESTRPF